MLGNNPIRKPTKGDGFNLEIQSIFKTFQGEGPFTGHPAIFIRLGGCNLACSFCDTEFESFQSMHLDDIIKKTNQLADKTHKLVVITGGEPFRQPIESLCRRLLEQNYKVQIETNGTLYRDIPKEVTIMCSPKNNNGYHPIREDLLERINAFKFIISKNNNDYSNIGKVGQNKYNTPVYVQPMDEYNQEKNQENLELAKDIATKSGAILSIQTHKIIGVE